MLGAVLLKESDDGVYDDDRTDDRGVDVVAQEHRYAYSSQQHDHEGLRKLGRQFAHPGSTVPRGEDVGPLAFEAQLCLFARESFGQRIDVPERFLRAPGMKGNLGL